MVEKRKRTRGAGTRRPRGDEARWALAVHGGAGTVPEPGSTPTKKRQCARR